MTRTGDGRVRVDLHQLPMWTRLTIAVAIVVAVVTAAHVADPAPRVAAWIGTLITIGGWAVLGLVAFLIVRWIVMR